ncbi:MAG: hypothetical protein JO131_10170 [Gammaproteobacteria bacterium]|nr:hypothetical protein [Gammaproteobacteria bacterium]
MQEVLSMTLEEFDDFVKANEDQLELYQIKKNVKNNLEENAYDTKHDITSSKECNAQQIIIPSKELTAKHTSSVVIEVQPEYTTTSESGSPRNQRWAHKLCSWWYKNKELPQEEKILQVQRTFGLG